MRGRESFVFFLGALGCRGLIEYEHAIPKCRGLAWIERKVQLLFSVAEDFLAQWVDGEEAIATRVPVACEAGVLGMVKDCDCHRITVDLPCQRAPASASPPRRRATLPFTRQIVSSGNAVLQLRHGGCSSAGVGERFRFFAGQLQRSCHPNAEHPLFVIRESDLLLRCRQTGDAIDASYAGSTPKAEERVLAQQGLAVGPEPVRLNFQLALVRAISCGDHSAVLDRPHLASIFRLDRVGIIPKVDSVYVA